MQLGVRFTLQALTGIDEKPHIEAIKTVTFTDSSSGCGKFCCPYTEMGGEQMRVSLENHY